MGIDTAHHRVFSGCRSGVMAVSDYQNGKAVATLPIGMGVDGAGYDAASGNAFASNGDGILTVIHQDRPDQYHMLDTICSKPCSRRLDRVTWGSTQSITGCTLFPGSLARRSHTEGAGDGCCPDRFHCW